MLQVALCVVIHERSTIELLHDLRVTASYDDMVGFKGSAALAAANNKNVFGLCNNGKVIQAVADYFDANISSQNGLQSKHSLVILMT